jgi:hypothetical protein
MNSGEDKSRGGSAARTGPRVTAESLVTLLCMQNGISIFRAVLFSKNLTTQREQMTNYYFIWYFFLKQLSFYWHSKTNHHCYFIVLCCFLYFDQHTVKCAVGCVLNLILHLFQNL